MMLSRNRGSGEMGGRGKVKGKREKGKGINLILGLTHESRKNVDAKR